MKSLTMLAAMTATVTLSACDAPDSDSNTRREQEQVTAEAARQVGLPRVANFTEKKLATRIEEMRDDPNLLTYAYMQGLDGKLRCFGKGIGFGIPYATQISNPQKVLSASVHNSAVIAQSEPNGLFMPSSADATWYMLINPKTGRATPTYVEPHLTVATFPLTGPIVADPCPA